MSKNTGNLEKQEEDPKPVVRINAPIDQQPPVQVIDPSSIEQKLGSRRGY